MPSLWSDDKAQASRDRWRALREEREKAREAQEASEAKASETSPRSPPSSNSRRSVQPSSTLAIHQYHRTVGTPLITKRGLGGGEFDLNGAISTPRPVSTWGRIPDPPAATTRAAALEGELIHFQNYNCLAPPGRHFLRSSYSLRYYFTHAPPHSFSTLSPTPPPSPPSSLSFQRASRKHGARRSASPNSSTRDPRPRSSWWACR